jgi:hypothetical protein
MMLANYTADYLSGIENEEGYTNYLIFVNPFCRKGVTLADFNQRVAFACLLEWNW